MLIIALGSYFITKLYAHFLLRRLRSAETFILLHRRTALAAVIRKGSWNFTARRRVDVFMSNIQRDALSERSFWGGGHDFRDEQIWPLTTFYLAVSSQSYIYICRLWMYWQRRQLSLTQTGSSSSSYSSYFDSKIWIQGIEKLEKSKYSNEIYVANGLFIQMEQCQYKSDCCISQR